jgi:hypothetical protein
MYFMKSKETVQWITKKDLFKYDHGHMLSGENMTTVTFCMFRLIVL